MVVEEEEEEEEEDEEGPRSFIMAHYHTLDTHSSVIHVFESAGASFCLPSHSRGEALL